MEIPLNFTDKHASKTLAQFLVIGQTSSLFCLSYLYSEAAGPIDALSTICIRVQQTDRVIAKRDSGPIIHRTTFG